MHHAELLLKHKPDLKNERLHTEVCFDHGLRLTNKHPFDKVWKICSEKGFYISAMTFDL